MIKLVLSKSKIFCLWHYLHTKRSNKRTQKHFLFQILSNLHWHYKSCEWNTELFNSIPVRGMVWEALLCFLDESYWFFFFSLLYYLDRAFTEMQLCIVVSLWSQSFSFLCFLRSLLQNAAVMVCSSGYWTACKPLRQLIKTLLKGKCPLCS